MSESKLKIALNITTTDPAHSAKPILPLSSPFRPFEHPNLIKQKKQMKCNGFRFRSKPRKPPETMLTRGNPLLDVKSIDREHDSNENT